jgi:RNA polymerase sigma-70 factor (ECF subfamily)
MPRESAAGASAHHARSVDFGCPVNAVSSVRVPLATTEGGSLGTPEHAPGRPPTGSDPDWDSLAHAAARGDADAFDALARAVHLRIHRWALAHVRDADEADDVTQQVLLRLYRHLGRWRGRGRFSSWLYRVTANEAVSWSSRSRRFAARVRDGVGARESSTAPALGEAIDRARLVDRATRQVRRLPPRQREVMDLVDLQGYEPAEVAEMLDLNPNTVRANLFKARRALRRRLLAGASSERAHPEAE